MSSFKFKIGDRIQIFDAGGFYSTYAEAYPRCNIYYKSESHECPTGAVGILVGNTLHNGSAISPEQKGNKLCGIRLDNGGTCVIAEECVEYEGTMLPRDKIKARHDQVYYYEWRNSSHSSHKVLKWFLRPEQGSNMLKVSAPTDAIFVSPKTPKFMDADKDAEYTQLFPSSEWLIRPATPNESIWAKSCMNTKRITIPPANMLWDRRQKEVKKDEQIIDNYDLI